MECNFVVGQMVVCVDPHNSYRPLPLEKGRIYTIKRLVEPPPGGRDIRLTLEEVEDEPMDYPGFRHWRFRAIRKTDISALVKAMEPA